MAAKPDLDLRPIESFEQLLEPFAAACKARERWRIGTESEKHAIVVDAPRGGPLPFEAPTGGAGHRREGARPSVSRVLELLAERHRWARQREHEGAPWISLLRGDASITLEPGGQLELSGAPLRTAHETAAEFAEHLAELRPIEEELGIAWLGLGFHPLARREELPWVPKSRYPIMRRYLPTRGELALDMMLRTCTVQANLDYSSEEDAIRKLRASLRIQPVVTAMFANSPFVEGRATGERSHRARVWLAVDPDRSGLLRFAWSERASFRDYIEWALDVPMFLVKRPERILENTGQTFRTFWREGFAGERATREDWLTHLNTLFPEVRLKKTIEVRGADAQRTDLVPALAALWKGLLYDDVALAELESLGSRWTYEMAEAARPAIARDGLRARLAEREVGEWSMDVLAMAERGLARIGDLDEQGRDERLHLAPLRALLERGQSPADALLEKMDLRADLVGELLTHARI